MTSKEVIHKLERIKGKLDWELYPSDIEALDQAIEAVDQLRKIYNKMLEKAYTND